MAVQHHHAALKSPIEHALEASAHQRFHYDAKSGHIIGFDGRCLDVNEGNKAAGTKVILYDKGAGSAPNQTWDYKDGYFITRMGTGFCIDINGGAIKDGQDLILWQPAGGNNQKWDIDEHGYIRSRGNPNFVIDVNGGPKPGKGVAKVTLWTAAVSRDHVGLIAKLRNCQGQRWHFDAKSGYITGFDGRVLDVEGGNKAAGTKVILYDKGPHVSPNQTWDYKDGYFMTRMGTGLCIDISGGAGNAKDGGELILWAPAGGANQKWDIDQFGFIRSRANAKVCIDVSGGAKPGKGLAKVHVWTAAI